MKQKCMQNSGKRWLSLLLTACMLLTMVPALAMPARAADAETVQVTTWQEMKEALSGTKSGVPRVIEVMNDISGCGVPNEYGYDQALLNASGSNTNYAVTITSGAGGPFSIKLDQEHKGNWFYVANMQSDSQTDMVFRNIKLNGHGIGDDVLEYTGGAILMVEGKVNVVLDSGTVIQDMKLASDARLIAASASAEKNQTITIKQGCLIQNNKGNGSLITVNSLNTFDPSNAVLNMEGGKIINNITWNSNSNFEAGVVALHIGTLNMSGGEITGNNTVMGAVLAYFTTQTKAKVIISGSSKICDNWMPLPSGGLTPANLSVYGLQVDTSGLQSDARIGIMDISLREAPVNTVRQVTTENTADITNCFTSDNSRVIIQNSSDAKNVVELKKTGKYMGINPTNYVYTPVAVGDYVQESTTFWITNASYTEPINNLSVTLCGVDANSFILDTTTLSSTIPAYFGSTSFTVKPIAGLSAGTYTAMLQCAGDTTVSSIWANITFTVNPLISIDYESLTANGTAGVETTTELTVKFDKVVTGLAKEDFSVTGATLDSIDDSGAPEYKLNISGIENNGDVVTVAVSKTNYTFTPASETVTVYKAIASSDATLSDLTFTGGTLSPVFAADVMDYIATVPNGTASIVVSPIANDTNATATVNGSPAPADVALTEGANTITVVVTAEDGTTTKTYTVTVTRAAPASTDAALSGLTISGGTLSPAFAADVTDYTATVPNGTASVTVAPAASDGNATVTVNGNPAPADIALTEGANTITVVVTAEDGTTTKTYTVTVTHAAPAPSSDAALSGLTLSGGTLSPAFAPDTTGYTASVPNGTSSITVSPAANDGKATVTVNGNPAPANVSLNEGANTVTVVVTAEDGTTKTYTVTVTRAASSGGDTGSTSGGTPSTGSSVNIGGKNENIGKVETTKDTTTVVVDDKKLGTLITDAKDGSTVTVPVTTTKDGAAVQLGGKSMEDMADKGMTLEVKSGNTTYELPSAAIDTKDLAAKLGAGSASDITITVTITTGKDDVKVEGADVIGKPVSFEVTASSNGETVSVDRFDTVVTRVIEITAEQAQQITTAVVYEKDGSVRHIPTFVFVQNGRYYAKINSMTNSTYVLIHNQQSFTDVSGKWYESAANELASRKVTDYVFGTTFAGDRAITRAEFASLIVRALGLPVSDKATFNDVASDAWYSELVATAAEYGIVMGVGDNQFVPEATITRQEAMAMLTRAAAKIGWAGDSAAAPQTFPDQSDVAAWAEQGVSFNTANGLIVGKDGMLDPNGTITRAETATVLLRLMQKSGLVDVRAEV